MKVLLLFFILVLAYSRFLKAFQCCIVSAASAVFWFFPVVFTKQLARVVIYGPGVKPHGLEYHEVFCMI
jgi:hypothetical protein